jgi:hypothetical protein
VRWNWVADLPFGRGKWLGRNAGGLLDRLIGGWQIAGMGWLRSNYFALPTGIYPTGEKIEIYGYKYPIEDCTSGVCWPGYLWWNGYIPANRINSYDPVTGGTELEFVIMVIAVSCVKLLSAHNSTQHTSRKHKV